MKIKKLVALGLMSTILASTTVPVFAGLPADQNGQRTAVVLSAKSQLGKPASDYNWYFYSEDRPGNWSARFVSWVMSKAGCKMLELPEAETVQELKDYYDLAFHKFTDDKSYVPAPGDIVFFNMNDSDAENDVAGIVEDVNSEHTWMNVIIGGGDDDNGTTVTHTEGVVNFPTYNLSEDQIRGIAHVIAHEQSDIYGQYAEASQMVNWFENHASKSWGDASQLANFIANSGHYGPGDRYYSDFCSGDYTNYSENHVENAIKAVRDVMVNGKRTLPAYVDEHDGRFESGFYLVAGRNRNDPADFIPHDTIWHQMYSGDVDIVFYEFPGGNTDNDPFGYYFDNPDTKARRAECGDFCYDIYGNPKNGGTTSTEYIQNNVVVERAYSLDDPKISGYVNPEYIKVRLGNKTLSTGFNNNGLSPYINSDGVTFIPLRTLTEGLVKQFKMDIQLEWSQKDGCTYVYFNKPGGVKVLTLKNGDTVTYETKDSETGEMVTVSTQLVVDNGRFMVPLRWFAEEFGLNVAWNEKTNQITVALLGDEE